MAPEPGAPAAPRGLAVEWLGAVPYAEALELQAKRVEALRQGAAPEVLLLLEHPPVITLGRSGRLEHLLAPQAALEAGGIPVHRVSRGGDITFHGPGQLVGYLILDLARRGTPDVSRFLRDIEAALVEVLATLGVAAHARPGLTGVFLGKDYDPDEARPRKIASIGVGLRGWVTWHGFALNVHTDLAAFRAIVPCGLRNVAMTSVAEALAGEAPDDIGRRAREAVAGVFARRFAARAA